MLVEKPLRSAGEGHKKVNHCNDLTKIFGVSPKHTLNNDIVILPKKGFRFLKIIEFEK